MSGFGIFILISLFFILVVFPCIRHFRNKKIETYREYSSNYPYTTKKYEQQFKSQGIHGERMQKEIGSMSKYVLSCEERLINSANFKKEIESNTKRFYFYRKFVFDSINEEMKMDKSLDLSERISRVRQKLYELESNDDLYKSYILKRLQYLDEYIEKKIDEKYEFLKSKYPSSFNAYLGEHPNYTKFQIIVHESEIIKQHNHIV